YFPISYGVNVDICDINDKSNNARYNPGATQSVTGGPKDAVGNGSPLQAHLSRCRRPHEVLLYADCGTRPSDTAGSGGAALAFNDGLTYTTNFSGFRTLGEIMSKGYLQRRVPLDRHGRGHWIPGATANASSAVDRKNGRINVGFADGHGET